MLYLPETMANWPWPRAINPHYEEVKSETNVGSNQLTYPHSLPLRFRAGSIVLRPSTRSHNTLLISVISVRLVIFLSYILRVDLTGLSSSSSRSACIPLGIKR